MGEKKRKKEKEKTPTDVSCIYIAWGICQAGSQLGVQKKLTGPKKNAKRG
jgi:hypothetical protein